MPKLKQHRVNQIQEVNKGGKDFLLKFNFDACSQFICNNPLEALGTKLPRLNEIALAFNRDTPILLLSTWLLNFCQFVGIEITDQQAERTSKNIFKEVPMFNIAELITVFNRLERGIYGKFYSRFDGITVVQAFIEYRKERAIIFSRLSSEKQKEFEFDLF